MTPKANSRPSRAGNHDLIEPAYAVRRTAMSNRIFAAFAFFLSVALASGQDAKKDTDAKKEPVKYEDVLQKLVDSIGKISKTLALVVDEESAKANRPALRMHAMEFIETRKKSRELAPPVGET